MSEINFIVKASEVKSGLLKNLLTHGASGLGQATFWDQAMYAPDDLDFKDSLKSTYDAATFNSGDKTRQLMFLFNTLAGGAGTKLLGSKDTDSRKLGLGTLFGIPAKDAIITAGRAAHTADKTMPKALAALEQIKTPENQFSTRDKLIAAAMGLGALGLGAYGINRLGKGMDEKAQLANAGRVTLTLPTKDPKDVETQVTIPLSDTGVSAKTYQQLGRDVRRRLRSESKERQVKFMQAVEQGMDPIEAGLFKTSTDNKQPLGFLAGSHIKAIAKEHTPPDMEQEAQAEPEQKVDLKPINTKVSEQNKKLSEQEKRIKQLEKYLGQVNGNKLSRVQENLRGISKKAYMPTAGQVNMTPEAFGTKGGVMGLNIYKPQPFGRAASEMYGRYLKPFIQQSQHPLLQKLFGYTKPSPNAIVPIGPI